MCCRSWRGTWRLCFTAKDSTFLIWTDKLRTWSKLRKWASRLEIGGGKLKRGLFDKYVHTVGKVIKSLWNLATTKTRSSCVKTQMLRKRVLVIISHIEMQVFKVFYWTSPFCAWQLRPRSRYILHFIHIDIANISSKHSLALCSTTFRWIVCILNMRRSPEP